MPSHLFSASGTSVSGPGGAPIAQRTVLPNGLPLIIAEQNFLPIIHLQVLIKAGASLDPAGQLGLAGLTAELLPQGTTHLSAVQINQRIESVGGYLSASSGRDYATVSLWVLRKDLLLGMELLADVLLNPLFDPQEMERKVQEFKARLRRMDEDPRQVARLAFSQRLFGTHPYAYPVEGSSESLAHLTREQVAAFFQRYYRPANAALVLAGNLSMAEAVEVVRASLGGWKPGPAQRPGPIQSADLSGPVIEKIDRPISQANIIWGHLGIARSNPDFYALQVMNYLLGGGGFVSRLMDTIRDNLGLTYGIRSQFEALEHPGAFLVSLETENSNANRAISETLRQIRKFQEEGITETELEEARDFLTGSFPLRMDTGPKLVRLLVAMEFYGLGMDYPERYLDQIRRTTREDILRVARTHLHPDRYLLVVVGDQGKIRLKESW